MLHIQADQGICRLEVKGDILQIGAELGSVIHYLYNQITDDERRELLDGLEGDRIYVEETPTVSSEALMVLEDFASRLRREIDSFQFDLLPPKEQDRILREREERLEKAKKRRLG